MSRRLRAALAGATALVLVTTACGAGTSGNGQSVVFRVGFGGDPVTLDPHLSPPAYNIFLSPVYDTLIKSTRDGGYAPGLATEWSLSEDALSLSLTLRANVTFQDGEPFNGESVRANLEAAKAPGTLVARNLTVLDRVEVVDDTHVVLHLNAPGGNLVGVLASETGMMVSPSHLDSDDLARKPVGAGPFTLTELTGGRTSYTKWEGYWDADNIVLDGIEIHGFSDDVARMSGLRSGELDATYLFPSQIGEAEQVGMTTTVYERTVFHALLLNTSRSEFGNPLVRQALDLAIDRATIADTLYDGYCTPTRQPYPDGYWASAPDLGDPVYDPEQARRLLAEAGLPNGFSFTLAISNITTFQRLGVAVQGALARIGVTVQLKIMDNPSLTALRQKGDFDAVGGSYESGRPDPTTFLTDFYLPGGIFNPGGFDIPGGQPLVAQAQKTVDVQRRQAPVQRLVADVAEAGPPILPICFPGTIEADAEHVTNGVTVSIVGNYDFTTVRMNNN